MPRNTTLEFFPILLPKVYLQIPGALERKLYKTFDGNYIKHFGKRSILTYFDDEPT